MFKRKTLNNDLAALDGRKFSLDKIMIIASFIILAIILSVLSWLKKRYSQEITETGRNTDICPINLQIPELCAANRYKKLRRRSFLIFLILSMNYFF